MAQGQEQIYPPIPELPETSVVLTVSLGHFSSTTAYLFAGSEAQSVSPSSTVPFQMAHSTILPRATTIPSGNIVVNHAPIGTPRSARPTPSLPLGYHALNSSAAIHTQIPSGVPLGHNTSAGYVPTPSQVLSGGSYPPLHGGSGPSGSNPIGSTHHLFTSVTIFPLGGNLMPGGNLNLGVTLKLGHLLLMEDILRLELIIHNLDRMHQTC
jgi:hypothetical protein